MEMTIGAENDINYRVYLGSSDWIAEVKKGDKILTESWHWAHEPTCGPHIDDAHRGELVLQKLIKKIKKQ